MIDPRARLLRKYQLSPAEHAMMLEAQSGRCAICRTANPGTVTGVWPVDHNHATRRVRALLCTDCNAGIGHFKDQPELLRAAAIYLETVVERPRWQDLSPAEKVEYLLSHITISDGAWTTEPRRPNEKREAFIRRVLGAVTEEDPEVQELIDEGEHFVTARFMVAIRRGELPGDEVS